MDNLMKPVDTLIQKVSDAVGMLYEPTRMKRKAEVEIEIADLQRRAEQRRKIEDIQHQKNIENIMDQTTNQLNEEAKPENMEKDWVANFFDKVRIVSDSEMQSLWARILAGEANSPGTFSKRTVNFVAELEKYDAEVFANLCKFVWLIDVAPVPLVFDCQAEIYNRYEINFNTLTHFDSIGLIHFNSDGFSRIIRANIIATFYRDKPLSLKIPEWKNGQLMAGSVRLTQIGYELQPICESEPVDGFYEYAKEYWANWEYDEAI